MNQVVSLVLSPPLLLATDGSSGARFAQQMVRPIAQVLQKQQDPADPNLLTVITVQPRSPKSAKRLNKKAKLLPGSSSSAGTSEAEIISLEQPNGVPTTAQSGQQIPSPDRLLAQVQADFPTNFPIKLEIRQGRPATEILNCARSLQAGLIAVGHRGSGGVRELLLGSVSTAIARYAPCSVLVARSTPASAIEPSLRHVLLVVDGSPATQPAIATVQQLLSGGIQQITLLYIQSPLNANYFFAPFVSSTPNWQLNQSLKDAQREQSEQILQPAKTAFNDLGIVVQSRVQSGDPGPVICHVAQELGVNLVILGSDPTRRSLLPQLPVRRPGRRNNKPQTETRAVLRNTRLSPTEDYIIHYAPCPVLLCRSFHSEPQHQDSETPDLS